MGRHRCPILQRPICGAAELIRHLSRLLLACSLALLGAGLALPAHAAARPPSKVVVQDPYVDLRSGPGRGFPATYSVERSAIDRAAAAADRLDQGAHGVRPRRLGQPRATRADADAGRRSGAGRRPEARGAHRASLGSRARHRRLRRRQRGLGRRRLRRHAAPAGARRRQPPARQFLERLARHRRASPTSSCRSGACRRSSASAAAC